MWSGCAPISPWALLQQQARCYQVHRARPTPVMWFVKVWTGREDGRSVLLYAIAAMTLSKPPGESLITSLSQATACADSTLFQHLSTTWTFHDAHASNGIDARACEVDFAVKFEFKSAVHAQLSSVFFESVVKEMVNAFERRAAELERKHGRG